MEIKIDSLDFNELTLKDKNGNVQTFNIHDELKLSEYTIQEEMYSQSAKYSWWSSLLERVRVYEEAEERKLEQLGAQLNQSVRNQFTQQKIKPTKDMIESAILTDSNYQQQQDIVAGWNYKVRQLHYIVKAFEQRMGMLTQISADLRQTNKNGGITNPFSH
ncbi:hypothetical protein CF5_0142 [Staphylococcus phage CF5]|uniref:Uncharacterized protein n=1 Tax=Staphylococcus phage CF5 TaxID=3113739 RepID=A0AAX4J7J3_9CAUD|nr:hypothetical protein CF5_0142 [Staphylococcus phage CF5]